MLDDVTDILILIKEMSESQNADWDGRRQSDTANETLYMSEVRTNLVSNDFNHQSLFWLNFLPYMYLENGYLKQLLSNGRF